MCMLQRTQGRLRRPQATEATAPKSWDLARHQSVAQAGCGCRCGTEHSDRIWNLWLEPSWGYKRWGQHGRWTTVGAEPSCRTPGGVLALAPLTFSSPLPRTVAHTPPLTLLPICICSSSN